MILEVRADAEALERIGSDDIRALTERATRSAFYIDGLTEQQLAANRRVVEISAPTAIDASRHEHQYFAATFAAGRFAGYVISTVHSPNDRELDWLMVDPDFHGSGVSALLMQAGIDWLGSGRPMWLNVLQHNGRAISFYRRFGFEIDPEARTSHAIPHHVMRRPAMAVD